MCYRAVGEFSRVTPNNVGVADLLAQLLALPKEVLYNLLMHSHLGFEAKVAVRTAGVLARSDRVKIED